jgi:acetolactate decarboxylase
MSILFQYGISEMFEHALYDGKTTIKELKTKGHYGLGAFHALEGEFILIDGIFYKSNDCKIEIAHDNEKVCWAALTKFNPNKHFELLSQDYDQTKKTLKEQHFQSLNLPIAFSISGIFDRISLCSVSKQEKPYKKIEEVIAETESHLFHNLEGIAFGYYAPPYLRHLKATRFHLHFVDKDRKIGGHVLDFSFQKAQITLETLTQFHVEFPINKDFQKTQMKDYSLQMDLDKDHVKPAA